MDKFAKSAQLKNVQTFGSDLLSHSRLIVLIALEKIAESVYPRSRAISVIDLFLKSLYASLAIASITV